MDLCSEDSRIGAREDKNGAQQQSTRKSGREKRQRQSFSPDSPTVTKKSKTSIRTSKKKKAKTSPTKPSPNTGFCCWLCQSPYVSDPLKSKHGSRNKKSRHNPSPKIHFDPVTNKTVEICNACALLFNPVKKTEPTPQLKPEEKEKLLSDAKNFGVRLAEELQDKDAERLYCSNLKSFSICGCIQKYLDEDREQRARNLLHFMKEARRLSKLKSYKNETDKKMYIGLGNGQKKSKEYENFVLHKREHIRHELKLCEIASKQILLYSNNFLHKNIKTEERRRMKRTKCKGKLNCLPEIATLHEKTCCVDNCVKVALTHSFLLHEWRNRAQLCQVEARRVLAEMLTPSGGYRCNCYKFIHWVTGCSNGTIHRVSSQMKATKGNREPPRHGLRRNWEFTSDNHSSINTSSDRDMNTSHVSSDPSDNQPSIRHTSVVDVKTAAENEQDERLYQLQKQILDELAEKPQQKQQKQHQSNISDAPSNMQNMQILLEQLTQLQQSSLQSSAVTMATRLPPTTSSVPQLSHHSYSIKPTHQNNVGPRASASSTAGNPRNLSVTNQFSPTGAVIGNHNKVSSVQAQTINPAIRLQSIPSYQPPNPAPAAVLSSQSQNPPSASISKHQPPNPLSVAISHEFQNPIATETVPLKKSASNGVTTGYSHNASISENGVHTSLSSPFVTTSISVPAFHSAPIQLLNSTNSKASQYLPNNSKTALIHESPVSVPHQVPGVGGSQVSSYVSQVPSVLPKNTIQGFIGENGIVNFITQLPLDSCTFITSDASTQPAQPSVGPVAQAPTNAASVQILPFQPIQNHLGQTQNIVEPTYILTSPPAAQLMSYNTQLQPDVQPAQTIVYQLPANFQTLPVQQRTTHIGTMDNQGTKVATSFNQINNVVTTCAQNSVSLGGSGTSSFSPSQTNQQTNQHQKQNSVVALKPQDPKVKVINNSKKKPEKKGVSKYRKILSATELQPPETLTDSLVGNSKSIHVIAHSTRNPPNSSAEAAAKKKAEVSKNTMVSNKMETQSPKSKRSNRKSVSNLATNERVENRSKISDDISNQTNTNPVNPVVMPTGGASYETRVNLKQTIMDRSNSETQQMKQTIVRRTHSETHQEKQTIVGRTLSETRQEKQTIVDGRHSETQQEKQTIVGRTHSETHQEKQTIVGRTLSETQQVNNVKMSVEQPLKIRHKSGNHSAMQTSLAPSATPIRSNSVSVSTPISLSGSHYPSTSHQSALVPVASPENDHVLSFINSDLDLGGMRSRNNSGEPTIDLSFTSLSASDLLQILSSQQDYTRTQLL